jgi:4-hydroxy-tetrahydrodipicolinate synthase
VNLWEEARWSCAALVTPIDAQGRIDVARLGRFARHLLARGLNGVVPFGTMGEGPSFPASERLEGTARLIEGGIEPGQIVLGIGSSSIAEMAWMARQAGELGIAAVLATPPFFFRDVDQEGVFRAYAALVEAAGASAPPLLLYHIPQVAGLPVALDTVVRLVGEFPEQVRGIKDSEANPAYTEALLKRLADRLAVLVGAEELLPRAMALGGRGTVCGMANLIPQAIADLVAGAEGNALRAVDRLGAALSKVPVIPSVKAAVGECLGEPGWRACVPPLLPATDEQAAAVAAVSEL